MVANAETVRARADCIYKYGIATDIEADVPPPGLNEDIIPFTSAKKSEPERPTEGRLKAYRGWLQMREPHWSTARYPAVDYQSISYYATPKGKGGNRPRSLDEVDPELLRAYEK